MPSLPLAVLLTLLQPFRSYGFTPDATGVKPMPVIAIANPKGGAGKSTTALLLSQILAAQGASVTVFDCDPNHPIHTWRGGESKSAVEVIGDTTEANVLTRLDEYRIKRQFVILDLEGTASRLTSRAFSRAQLIVIPIQASTVDADQAAKAISLVMEEEQSFERKIPFRIVLTRTSPRVKTRIEQEIIKDLVAAGIPTFNEQINERAAFKAMFHYKLALEELDPTIVNGVDKAIENAERFAAELIDILVPSQEKAA
jgi:chromosome partitioning protein